MMMICVNKRNSPTISVKKVIKTCRPTVNDDDLRKQYEFTNDFGSRGNRAKLMRVEMKSK